MKDPLDNPVSQLEPDLSARISLLKNHPIFTQATITTLRELANYLKNVNYVAGDIIVTEGDIVDCIFFIAAGQAEVTKKEHTVSELVATLHPGESIGLDDVGFFSRTGVRTATVKAATALHLLRLDLEDFKQFLQNHPEFNLEKITNTFLYMNFIKQVEPFADIDLTTLHRAAAHIEEINIPAGEVIFQQGDEAHCCYLLCSGMIEIVFTKADGSSRKITELEPYNIFGEVAILTEAKRNATVKTITPAKLLILNRDDLAHLAQQNKNISQALLGLMMDRDRPKKIQAVTLHQRKAADGEYITILKNPLLGKYMKIPNEAILVWELLDGEHTLLDIAIEFYKKHNVLAIDEIGDLIMRFIDDGFIEAPNIKLYSQPQHLSWWMHTALFIKKIMEFEIPFNNVDHALTKAYQSFGYLFYTTTAKIIMALIAVSGLIMFISFFPTAEYILSNTKNTWVLFVCLIPATAFIVIPHELAHAFTTKAYGRQVHRMGIGWFWTGPVAFTDTSDMWLSTNKPRMIVNIAGIYCNIIIGGIAAILAWFIGPSSLAVFLWLFCFLSYALAIHNLNPTIELDGYYLLMDFFDRSNLRAKAIMWLVKDSKKTFHDPVLLRQHLPEIYYWASCILFFFLSSFITYLIATYILGNTLPFTIGGFQTAHLRWILPLLAIILPSISLYASIKRGIIKYK